jgi:hypothetical protein
MSFEASFRVSFPTSFLVSFQRSVEETMRPLTDDASGRELRQEQATMKVKRTKSREEAESDVGRRWVVEAEPKPKTSPVINTALLVAVLAVLCLVVYLNRARIGAFWEQVTGKAPPVWVMPEKPEHEGPEIEGRDF